MDLYPLQQKGYDMLRQSFREGHKRPMFQAPTGYGKTVVAGKIIEAATAKGNPTAFIVDRLALVDQASRHLDEIGIEHGVIQGSHEKTNYSKPVQVISIQTLARRKRWEFGLGLIDEAHVRYKEHEKIFTEWNKIPMIGLSATPWSKGLGLWYDDLIIPTSYEELIKEGYLCESVFYAPYIPNLKGVKTTAGDYNEKQLAAVMGEDILVADLVRTWLDKTPGTQTITFAVDIAHSKKITQRFRAAGVDAVHIDAYMDREICDEIIAKFKAGEIMMISSVGKLTTGFDAPNAETMLCARPTKSLILWIQMIGRVLRIAEGKAGATVLDHAGNAIRLGTHLGNDFPILLDKTEPKERQKKREREKLPDVCPSCRSIKTVHKCPVCGFAPEKQSEIAEASGELVALEGKKANKTETKEEKSSFYSGLLGYAKKKQFKEGWAAYKYKEKYGVWPNHYKHCAPKEPDEKVLNFIKYLAIKKRYSKEKSDANNIQTKSL